MNFTLQEVVDFCWTNKKVRAFKGFSYHQVCKIIIFAANRDMLKLVQDDQGLCGVAVFYVKNDEVFVDFLVAVRGGFRTLVAYYKEHFHGKKIKGERDGVVVNFNPRILCQQALRT